MTVNEAVSVILSHSSRGHCETQVEQKTNTRATFVLSIHLLFMKVYLVNYRLLLDRQ